MGLVVLVGIAAFVYAKKHGNKPPQRSGQVFSAFETGTGTASNRTETRTNEAFTVHESSDIDSRQRPYHVNVQPSATLDNPPSYEEANAPAGIHFGYG